MNGVAGELWMSGHGLNNNKLSNSQKFGEQRVREQERRKYDRPSATRARTSRPRAGSSGRPRPHAGSLLSAPHVSTGGNDEDAAALSKQLPAEFLVRPD